MKTETKLIHTNTVKDQFGSVTTPVYRTSTYAFDSVEEFSRVADILHSDVNGAYLYSRMTNPSTEALESKIAELEGAEAAVVTASGLGAITSVMWTFLKSGDNIVADNCLYGDTFALFSKVLHKFGVTLTQVDFNDLEAVKNALNEKTAIVYCESPANPTMKVNDLKEISTIAHSYNKDIKVIVDNTFNTGYIQRPIELGVDITVQSMTKYLGGHSDIVGGVVCGSKADMIDIRFYGVEITTGAVLSPDNAFLVTRGLSTLKARMDIHCQNAMKIAEYLEASPYIKSVCYPGLKSHPCHETAKKQMDQFGGMLSFETSMTFDETVKFITNLKIVKIAVSLGGVESLLEHPASMTHRKLTEKELEEAGISPTQIRLSVGIENVEDLIGDLQQAFESVKNL
ncbi:MAG: aminotransferase class I/II-fold pyridoxal phosphate-dependent enzyme [Clostridioides sp.]|jgi:methionine-gamma-lyase|nr:aminotransferase class I/II-fold pyridoxal phosphate-dependent enzyme [Clostridioides sp.]